MILIVENISYFYYSDTQLFCGVGVFIYVQVPVPFTGLNPVIEAALAFELSKEIGIFVQRGEHAANGHLSHPSNTGITGNKKDQQL